MKISLLRHGKTTSDGIYRGHTDVALTKQGLMQMHNTAKTFQVPVDYLVTSNLQRCAKFAAQLEHSVMTPTIKQCNDLRDMRLSPCVRNLSSSSKLSE